MQDPDLQLVTTEPDQPRKKVLSLVAVPSGLPLPSATSLQQRVYVLKKKMPKVPTKMNTSLERCVWDSENEICLSRLVPAPILAAQLVSWAHVK